MSESEKEKKIFLSYCGSKDQELLTGRKKMTLGDMERFSFLTEFFGLESYGINLWKEFGDHRLGGLLPRQLTNRTHAHHIP